jgi:hypothetical protein
VTIFFATNAACFDLKDDIKLDALLEEFGGNLHVLVEIYDRSIEHVGLEEWTLTFSNPLARGVKERAKEGVDLFGVAMVRVEGNEHIVFFSESVDGFGKDDCSKSGVSNGGAGCELATSGRNLNDPIRLGLGKGFESSVGSCERGDVDGRIGISTLLGGIEHLGVLFWGRDWHDCEGVTLDR